MKDMKEALSSGRKADTTHVRRYFQNYTARPCEWGNVKYERGNYLREPSPPREEDKAVDSLTARSFIRFRSYLRAARDHIDDTLQAMEEHLANDPHLEDIEGMKAAAYAVDLDEKPDCKFGASLLPHVAPACASLMMAIEQAVKYGLLPKDPGTPWEENRQHRQRRGLLGIKWPAWLGGQVEVRNEGPIRLRASECDLGAACEACNGDGTVLVNSEPLDDYADCGDCNGTGARNA